MSRVDMPLTNRPVQRHYAIGKPPPDSPFTVQPLLNTLVFSVTGEQFSGYLHTSKSFCQHRVHLHVSSRRTVEFPLDLNHNLPAELGGGDLDGVCPLCICLT